MTSEVFFSHDLGGHGHRFHAARYCGWRDRRQADMSRCFGTWEICEHFTDYLAAIWPSDPLLGVGLRSCRCKSQTEAGQNGDFGIRATINGSFRPQSCFNRTSYEACAETHCSRPRDALDNHRLLLRPAAQRHRDSDIAPALLLGRDRHRVD